MVAPVRTREEFAALRQSRARGRSGPIWVVRAPLPAGSATDAPARVAYAISKKVGSAVVRNRVRRRLRAVMADVGPDVLAPALYLVGVRPDVATLDFPSLRDRLVEAVEASAPRRSAR